MCSYNAVNGVPSCANKWLLGDILRKSWNFTGYVTSDSGAVQDILQHHHYTDDWPHTVSAAIKAGCDVESANWPPGHAYATGGPYIKYLPGAVNAGLVSMADLDAALRHALNMRFELGLFDPIEDQPYWHVKPSAVRSPEHLASSLDATRQGLVLLQNPSNNVLPFKAGKKVAVLDYDQTQAIGRRYRRQDEIGTPFCVTIDFDTLDDRAVTVRDRDSMDQERVAIDELVAFLSERLGA